ncbi:Hsp70 family protein [Sphingomonas arantia]|uniref:Hsp70 family protein n=1 Tax=Sphingomonas arantia TaxID=1460676 RepID=A0ABW4U0F9_9SPHN
MTATDRPAALGIDFGTTHSVVALAGAAGTAKLVPFGNRGAVFRSALCFWQDEAARGGLAVEAGPWAIDEYLDDPQNSRFLQSFKSVAASASFETASVFDRRYRFEELGRTFLDRLVAHGDGRLDAPRPERIIVGRPVEYAGARPDPALARTRYDAMFAELGQAVHYVYEPLGAAFSYAARLTHAATILVADFGGGTSDFSVVRVAAPGAARRCEPLGHAGIGIAGDRFDYRIVDRLVLPMLGKGGQYRSFGKTLEVPRSYYADFADWSRLALMRNRRTLDELAKLAKAAVDPAAIGRMIAVIENELGYTLYDAVGACKRALSMAESAPFRFHGGGVDIEAVVTRGEFEGWIAEDLERIAATVDRALAASGVPADAIDRVFLTGGSSLVPAVRAIFDARFGSDRIATGDELTAIAHGLALIGQEEDVAAWAA